MSHNSSKIAVSHIATKKHILTNRRSKAGKLVAVKPHHASVIHTQKQQITDVMQPSPNSLSLVNLSQIKYFLESNNARNIDKLDIRFQVTVSGGPIKLPVVSKWFDRVEFYIRDSGKEIGRLYNDVLHVMVNSEDDDVQRLYATTYNQSLCYDRNQEDNKVSQNGQQYYYLPLSRSFLKGMDLDLQTICSDIEIRFHPSNIMAQFAGSLSIDEVAGLIFENHPDVENDIAYKDFINRHVTQHSFTDSQQYIESSNTLNASTRYEFDLDQFDKPSSALLVCIRSTTNTNDYQCMDLYNGTFDLIGVSGESLYGGGREVSFEYFNKHIISEQYGNNFFDTTKMLIVPFGNLKDSLSGTSHGLHHFDSTKKRFRINTPAVGTFETYNAVFSASAATYTVRVSYATSYCEFLGNATDAQITLSVSNMLSSYGLKCEVDITAGPPYQILFTISTLNGQPIKLDENKLVVSMPYNTGATTFNSVTRVQGVNGWINGTYNVVIYSLYHRNIFQDGRNLVVMDM